MCKSNLPLPQHILWPSRIPGTENHTKWKQEGIIMATTAIAKAPRIHSRIIEKQNDFMITGLKEKNRLYSPIKTPCTEGGNCRCLLLHHRLSCPHTCPSSDHNKQGQLSLTSCFSTSTTSNNMKAIIELLESTTLPVCANATFPNLSDLILIF